MCEDINIVPLRRTSRRRWLSSLNHFGRRTPHLPLTRSKPGKSAASDAAGGQVTFPRRIINLLALSTDQKAQLQAILSRFQDGVLTAELEKQRAFNALEKAIMSGFDEGAVKQRQAEVVAASAKRVQNNVEMLTEMRKILTSEQVTRIRPELPLKSNDYELNVQLSEGFSDIGLSSDQNSQVGTVVGSRVPKMMTLSRKEKAAHEALEQAICSEQFDEAAVNQRREELVAVIAEQIEVNTGILFDARKILTPSQTKRLIEITPDQ
jgi:Spy/CpxP family protein refolding chaperone